LGFSLSLSRFQVTVESVVFLVDLAFEFLVDLELRELVLIKDVLEVLGAARVVQAVLVVGKAVLLESLVLLGDVLLVLGVFDVELVHLLLEFLLQFFDDLVLLVDFLVLLLVEGFVDLNQLFVQFAAAQAALLELAAKHLLLTVLIVEEQVFNTLHLVLELVHHVLGVFFLLAVTHKTLLESLAAVIR